MKARKWSLGISAIADDAVSAAERLKKVAPGASPGYRRRRSSAPEGAKDSAPCLSPLRGWVQHQHEPRAAARGYVLKPLRGKAPPKSHFDAKIQHEGLHVRKVRHH